jgi:hypothetical protein
MSTRMRILLGGLVVIAITIGAAGYVVLRSRHSTPVAERTAVARFRAVQGAAEAAGLPETGVYTYSVRGWECAGLGPLCLHRSLPSRAYAIVSRHGALLTIELDLSREHLEAQRFRLTPRGRLLVWQRTELSILGVSQDDAHTVSPETTLSVPASPHAGARWSQRFNDGGLPVSVENHVSRSEGIPVGDETLATWKIVSASITGGAHPGTEDDVDWLASDLGIDARFSIDRRIRGVFPYRLELTADLVSRSPAR